MTYLNLNNNFLSDLLQDSYVTMLQGNYIMSIRLEYNIQKE